MKKEYINNCSRAFNYGTIHDSICACSFWGDEDEQIDFQNILKELNLKFENQFLYFFTGKIDFYPMSFKDKKMGLWKNIENSYGLDITNYFEKIVLLNRFYLLFGIADIVEPELEKILPILQKEDRNSFVLITNHNLKSLEDFGSYVQVNENRSKYCLNFNDIINAYCKTPNDIIITAIQGFDGVSINLFSSQSGDGLA